MNMIRSVLEMHQQQKAIKEIARVLGLSRNTVRKYIREYFGTISAETTSSIASCSNKQIADAVFTEDQFEVLGAAVRPGGDQGAFTHFILGIGIVGEGDAHALTDAERRTLIDLPFTQAKLTFKQVRKALGLELHQRFNLLSYRPDPKGKDKDPEEA